MKKGGNELKMFVIMFAVVITALLSSMSIAGIWGKFDLNKVKSILNLTKNDKTYQSEIVNNDDLLDEEQKKSPTPEEESEGRNGAANFCASRQSASSGVLIEQSSKRVLLDENMHERCYPASTTKVLTALVVLKNLPLDMIVTVPKEAEGVEGSSIYLRAGQQISVEDLLYGLMLRSGNDAAVALAIATSGSVEKFAETMNAVARESGAYDSNFKNPHGLHDDEHYTTAYDLAMICAEAYELDDFKRIVSTKIARIKVDGEVCAIGNKNKLLKLYEGANGVKTGYTKTSGRCLVGGAKRDGMQLISVVLNYPDMWNDTERMLNYGFDNFEMISLDNALLTRGEIEIEIKLPQNVTSDWHDIRFPLKKDGSEYLHITSAN